MYINYGKFINESLEQLQQLEQKEKQAIVLRRLQLLRLLKSGQAKNMEEAALLVGISTVQARRMWSNHKKYGLEIAITCLKPGRRNQLWLSRAETDLQERVTKGYYRSLRQVQEFLLKKYKLSYTQAGVWHLLKTLNLQLMPKRAKSGYKFKGNSLK